MKAEGASDSIIVSLLRQNGWSEKRIYQALAAWYEARTGQAVPSSGGRLEAARDAFVYLLSFITLGIWTIQLGALLFSTVDLAFPNPTVDYRFAASIVSAMADQLASIIVGFPLFLVVTWWIVRGVERQPERLESAVRKWLTYLALVLAAGAVIADVVTFLAYFLRGDLSVRFVLKVATVMALAGGVFVYYLDSLRREAVSAARNRVFAIAALALVAFGIFVGFAQMGSPSTLRIATEDARRLFDLSSLAQAMHGSFLSRGREFVLQATIQELQRTAVGRSHIIDPLTGQPYLYKPLNGAQYRLCASFSSRSAPDTPAVWRPPAGWVCFQLDASEDVAQMPLPW